MISKITNVANVVRKVTKLRDKQNKQKLNIKWSKIQQVHQGRKIIDTKISSTEDHVSRFVLYQTSKKVPTLWNLWDQKTGTVWFLYGEGWDGAEISASKHVTEILIGRYRSKLSPKLVKKTVKK
jgi:hypothetical protein